MFLKTKVKADQINNLTDARYFAAAGIEWLGFSISDTMSIEDVQSITEWIEGVKIVLEITGQLSEEDYKNIKILRPDFIQLDIDCETNELFESIPVIKVIDLNNASSENILELLESNQSQVAGFIIDLSSYSWSDLQANTPININTLMGITQGYSCLLRLEFNAKNIEEVMNTLQLEGICLHGGVEEKVGYKDFDSLDNLIETLTLD